MLFNLWYDMPHRPTKDIDLLGFGDNDLAYIQLTFREICSLSASVGRALRPTFLFISPQIQSNEIALEPTTEEEEYHSE
ncbi:nucleotidyl transferase AbiEii/AbiGii toxin family protein [Legionella pneumophila serogroup 1]